MFYTWQLQDKNKNESITEIVTQVLVNQMCVLDFDSCVYQGFQGVLKSDVQHLTFASLYS